MDKIQDVVRSFDGCGNIETWLKKLKLVAKLKEMEKLEFFLPLFLEGDAFSVYDELSETSKDSSEKINAFAQNRYSAYDSFRQRSWTPEEAVDVYMSDLRRLARLSKIESDDVIRCAFICGLPADVSSIADPNIVGSMSGNNEHVVTVDGSVVKCKVGCVSLTVDGQTIDWQCLVLNSILKQFKLIIGMDIIHHLGGVNISKAGHVEFKQCASKQTISAISVREYSELDIHDVDFDAKFDDKKWTIKWKWVGLEPEFHNKLASYKINEHVKLASDTEVQS